VKPAAVASQAEIAEAAAILEAGGLVAFPTETVYGLGADAENPAAVARIYEAKGRPHDHPVIVHIAPGADLDYWTTEVPDAARKLAQAFWPGPLTLILKRHPQIPDAVSAGQDSVGIRCPAHPVAIALLRAFKGGQGGVAAPSANKFGNVSPTTAQHVRDEFGLDAHDDGPTAEGTQACSAALLGTVLEGGPSQVGIESTIVDMSRLATHGPVLLRPGHISAQQIADVIGMLPAAPDQAAPRASGTLESHYAPRTPVTMLPADELRATLDALQAKGVRVALIRHALPPLPLATQQRQLPADPAGYAYGLYAALRDMDQAGADLILVETPPRDADWVGVNDRLRRSVFGSAGIIATLLQK